MIKRRSGLPQYCSWNWDRHGKKRARFRRDGFSTYIYGVPYSDEFMAAYHRALEGHKALHGNAGADRTRPGSISALIASYYRSPEFRSLRPSTRTTYRGQIERFRAKHGDKLVRDLQRQHIKAIIGAMEDRKSAANNLLDRLRLLLSFGVDIGMIQHNPAVGLKGFKIRSSGFHTWTEDEIDQYRDKHAPGSKARLALELLLNTGQRRSDVIRMGWQHVDAGTIEVRQQKTDAKVWIPILPELADALAEIGRTNLTFITTQHGAPFTAAGFGNWFRDRCNEVGLKHCSAHGLRKAASRRLSEAGCTHEQIKSITGHQTDREVSRYTKDADRRALAQQAHDRLMRAQREQSLSNLDKGLDNSASKSLKSGGA